MAKNMKTPGVYIQETNAFPISIAPVATAIPVFIGFTGLTSHNGKNLINKAIKINSLVEFFEIFGADPPQVKFSLTSPIFPKKVAASPKAFVNSSSGVEFTANGYTYRLETSTINYRMYSSLKFFYENGGGACYIMSLGAYDYSQETITDITDFKKAISLLKIESKPTILVIPEVIEILNPKADPSSKTYHQDKYANAYSLQSKMINHCGEMMNRIAILDIPGGYSDLGVGTSAVKQFRKSVAPTLPKYNSYAAAYYPWLHTTVYQKSEINFANIDKKSYNQVSQFLTREFTDKNGILNPKMTSIISAFSDNNTTLLAEADLVLKNVSQSYQLLMESVRTVMNLMAPSAAMAGIYTTVDNTRGVWKAPANVGIQCTIAPAIEIDNDSQADLNAPLYGKSICAIRSFPGMGNLVWGARTLAGNSLDWRYINVRRTAIYIEQSVKSAVNAYAFESNDSGTWVNVKSMISNFLTDLWKQGGLAGAKPEDAYFVQVGLGSTMTPQDILNGMMIIDLGIAITRPAEFIVLKFRQDMQG